MILDIIVLLTQVNTNDLALDLLFTTLCRIPSPESSAGDSGGRGASENSARELLRIRVSRTDRDARQQNFLLGK